MAIDEKYPEIAKHDAVREQEIAITEFLKWLQLEQHGDIAFDSGAGPDDVMFRSQVPTQDLILEFFGIDPVKLEADRARFLADMGPLF
jgi:hypothetical protein